MDEWQCDSARRGWKRKHTCFCVRLELPVFSRANLHAAYSFKACRVLWYNQWTRGGKVRTNSRWLNVFFYFFARTLRTLSMGWEFILVPELGNKWLAWWLYLRETALLLQKSSERLLSSALVYTRRTFLKGLRMRRYSKSSLLSGPGGLLVRWDARLKSSTLNTLGREVIGGVTFPLPVQIILHSMTCASERCPEQSQIPGWSCQ